MSAPLQGAVAKSCALAAIQVGVAVSDSEPTVDKMLAIRRWPRLKPTIEALKATLTILAL